jgi:nicotinamidase-related amidase
MLLWPQAVGLSGWAALERIRELFAAARAAEVPIIHITGLGEEDSGMPPWAARRGVRATVPDDAAAADRQRRRHDIVEQTAPLPGEVLLRKTGPSAFFGTPLMAHLTAEGIDTLIVCGESTSGCVRASVVDARAYRLHVIVVEECVYDRHEASHAINLFDMDQKYADVLPLSEVIGRLQGAAA